MTGRQLPRVDPMMVRQFTLTGEMGTWGGVIVMDAFDVEEVGLVDARLSYDEPVVDCSNRIFQITTAMMLLNAPLDWVVFPSRRWRNYRTGQQIDEWPDATHPLLYLGNPIRLAKNGRGIHVERSPEFLIKSGPELGY